MAAIVPPPNASGVPPPNLVLPITYNDIASARTYLKDLSWTQGKLLGNYRLINDGSQFHPQLVQHISRPPLQMTLERLRYIGSL